MINGVEEKVKSKVIVKGELARLVAVGDLVTKSPRVNHTQCDCYSMSRIGALQIRYAMQAPKIVVCNFAMVLQDSGAFSRGFRTPRCKTASG